MYWRRDVLHSVVNCQARGNDTTGRVDVELDGTLGVLCFEKEQLGSEKRRILGIYLHKHIRLTQYISGQAYRTKKDNSLPQQP